LEELIDFTVDLRVKEWSFSEPKLERGKTMRRTKSEEVARNEQSYIFYICLMLVLAIAALNIIFDITRS
jgi:hypothetical protein